MKRYALLLALLPVVASCHRAATNVALDQWQLCYNGTLYQATVPGFVHTDLMHHGLIADPYLATNEGCVQWVADSTWRYLTALPCNLLPSADTLWLVFDGLAGTATVLVDGNPVGTADNMFVQHAYAIARPDADTLHVEVLFHPLADSLRQAAYGIALPDRRAFTRIAPYQQGWDWGPRLQTCGIWQRAYLSATKPNTCAAPLATAKQCSWGVELRQQPDSIGQCFTFYRNGKPLFVKGANWIPAHSFPVDSPALRARYRMLLTSAKEAGFNMLRVWGGGIYEHDCFYSLCDSLGIMVWQDFNFSTMLYPDTPDMLASIYAEARQQVSRIAQHPCVVLWCGNNEVKNGFEDWGWQGVYHWTDAERSRLQHAMDTIFGYTPTPEDSTLTASACNTSHTSLLARAVAECDPQHRPYITTSPLFGWGHPECTTHGDSHYWGVWWGELPFEAYRSHTGRFMSEYGFQSYPMLSTIERFCPSDELYISSPTMRAHQKHGRGLEIIDHAMQRYYGFDSRSLDLDDFAYVSQLLQAWGVGYGILCHLTDPRCSGTLYWQLDDCWPVASWSSIDYYGNWKALHYRAQALFADTVDVGRWQRYYSLYPKQRQYQPAQYTTQQRYDADGQLLVTVEAQTDVYDLFIDTYPHIDGHFSANFVDLPAASSIEVRFVPVDAAADVRSATIVCRTLNDIYLKHRPL